MPSMISSGRASSGSEDEERVFAAARSQSESDRHRGGCFSGSEVERRKVADRRVPLDLPPVRRAPPKKQKQARRYTCAFGLRELMGLLAILGPLGTFVSLWVLPEKASSGMTANLRRAPSSVGSSERARVIHLTLAGNERKARFVLSRDVGWEDFLAGVQERLQLGGINRIETSAGEAIMSAEDLMHDDHLIIYSDAALSSRGRLLFSGRDGLPNPIGGKHGAAPSLPLPEPLQLLRRRAAARGGAAQLSEGLRLAAEGLGELNSTLSSAGIDEADDVGDDVADGDASDHYARQAAAAKVAAEAAASAAAKAASAGAAAVSFGEAGHGTSDADGQQADGSLASMLDAGDHMADVAAAQAQVAAAEAKAKAAAAVAAADAARATAEAAHASELNTVRERHRKAQEAFKQQSAAVRASEEPAQGGEAYGMRAGGAANSYGGAGAGGGGGGGGGGADGGAAEGAGSQLPRCMARHAQYRIGMVVPWVGEFPVWASYFFASAATAAPLADFLIFHEGQKHLTPEDLPSNVLFNDVGPGGLAQLFGMGLSEVLELPIHNATVVIKAMRFMFEKWPRLVAEYKPAFGSIFASYLKPYTHWGYCDLDMVIGNLPLFLEQGELEDHDIVSYSFGDQEALYLRGQWTMHRNVHFISTIWKGCPHLGEQLQKELLLKVAWVRRMESRGIQNYPKRFQSAEGCYSQRAVATRGVRIKVANKQFVGLTVPAESTIYTIGSAVWQCPRDIVVDLPLLARHAASGRCQVVQRGEVPVPPAVQIPLGPPAPLALSAEGCGRWMPVEYRMCANELIDGGAELASSASTFYADDSFTVQRYRTSAGFALPNGCRQGAIFHFQEWKKAWAGQQGYGATMVGVEPVGAAPRYSARQRNFTITPEGISLIRSPAAAH